MTLSNTDIKETATETVAEALKDSSLDISSISSISSIPYSIPTSVLPYPSPTTFLQSIANLQAIYKYCMEEMKTKNEKQQETQQEIHNKQM